MGDFALKTRENGIAFERVISFTSLSSLKSFGNENKVL